MSFEYIVEVFNSEQFELIVDSHREFAGTSTTSFQCSCTHRFPLRAAGTFVLLAKIDCSSATGAARMRDLALHGLVAQSHCDRFAGCSHKRSVIVH